MFYLLRKPNAFPASRNPCFPSKLCSSAQSRPRAALIPPAIPQPQQKQTSPSVRLKAGRRSREDRVQVCTEHWQLRARLHVSCYLIFTQPGGEVELGSQGSPVRK